MLEYPEIMNARLLVFLTLIAFISGCATTSTSQQTRDLQGRIDALNQQVSQLEQRRDGSSATSSSAWASSAEAGQSSADGEESTASSRAGGAFQKFFRGGVNLLTGWVEIPKRITETSQQSGAAAGLTWGLLRGLGYGFIRTTAGLYEMVTFPAAAPSGFRSVIQPEFVF